MPDTEILHIYIQNLGHRQVMTTSCKNMPPLQAFMENLMDFIKEDEFVRDTAIAQELCFDLCVSGASVELVDQARNDLSKIELPPDLVNHLILNLQRRAKPTSHISNLSNEYSSLVDPGRARPISLMTLHDSGDLKYSVIIQNTNPSVRTNGHERKAVFLHFPDHRAFAKYVCGRKKEDRTFYETICPGDPCLVYFDIDVKWEDYNEAHPRATHEQFQTTVPEEILCGTIKYVTELMHKVYGIDLHTSSISVASGTTTSEISYHVVLPYILIDGHARWEFKEYIMEHSDRGSKHCGMRVVDDKVYKRGNFF
jgi:hypothetical protein